jgi:phage FluMu protein Com
MIKFKCAKCGKEISAADEHAGRKAKCPGCQTILQIPGARAAPAPPKPVVPAVEEDIAEAVEEAPPRPRKPAVPAVKAGKPHRDDDEDDVQDVEELEEVPAEDEEDEEEERPRRRRQGGKFRKRASEEPLEGYWKAIIWGSLLVPCLGGWVIVILSSVMYYVWLKDYPVKAKSINRHGWLAWLTGQALGVLVYALLGALTGKH